MKVGAGAITGRQAAVFILSLLSSTGNSLSVKATKHRISLVMTQTRAY